MSSISEIGEIKESDLLSEFNYSTSRLLASLVSKLFFISIGIQIMNYIVFFLLWILATITFPIVFVVYIEASLLFIYASIGGSFKASITVSKLREKLKIGEPISRAMVNRALKSSLSFTILGLFLFIEAVIMEMIGIVVIY